METIQVLIGRKIRAYRALCGMSQEELARQVGIPQEHVSRYERGKWIAMNPDYLIKIARALGVSVGNLFGELEPAVLEPAGT